MFILSNDEVHKIYKEIFEGDYVPHIEDKPKFPDKDILDIAIDVEVIVLGRS